MNSNPPRLLRLAATDNVAVAIVALEAGESVVLDGQSLVLLDPVPAGHKVATSAIPAHGKVIKYAMPIGSATGDIRPGQHVHTHNLQSDYLPSHGNKH